MIERKIRAGMTLDFAMPTYNGYVNNVDVLQPVPTLYCHVWREGTFSSTRGVGSGQLHRQGHRNFVWLPYRGGYVTFSALEHGDVLSGPFTGCRMLLLEVNGVRQVYHVGTVGAADTAETLRTKRAAHALISDADVTYVCGFSPFENFKPPPDALPGESPIPRILGLITHNGDMFSILMRKQAGSNLCRVVDVQPGQAISRADALAFFNV